jgi:hypothetical protein
VFATAIHFHTFLIFAGKVPTLPAKWILMGTNSNYKVSLGLNIRPGWKRMAVANTLAYYNMATKFAL